MPDENPEICATCAYRLEHAAFGFFGWCGIMALPESDTPVHDSGWCEKWTRRVDKIWTAKEEVTG